jgi:hypothetical protein
MKRDFLRGEAKNRIQFVYCFSCLAPAITRFQKIGKPMKNILSAVLLVSLAACIPVQTNMITTTTGTVTTPSPQVIVTYWTAELKGTLVMEDQCLRVKSSTSAETFLLAWPADFSVSKNGNAVHVIQGMVSGQRQEYDLLIGSQVDIGGGVAEGVEPSFYQLSDTSCPGPFWVFGGLVKK